MNRRNLNLIAVGVLGAVLLGACHRPVDPPAARIKAEAAPASLAAIDSGASLLADVDNARAAIAERDTMAADNDLAQASLFAVRLPDSLSDSGSLHPSQAIPAPLSAFQAEVMLTTAQSRLDRGDLAGADAALAAVQPRVLSRLAAVDMPLLRADQSLDLARIAVASQRAAELRTQLQIAERALDGYRGRPHAADVAALATAIERTLERAGALQSLQPDRLDAWSDRVDGWS